MTSLHCRRGSSCQAPEGSWQMVFLNLAKTPLSERTARLFKDNHQC